MNFLKVTGAFLLALVGTFFGAAFIEASGGEFFNSTPKMAVLFGVQLITWLLIFFKKPKPPLKYPPYK